MNVCVSREQQANFSRTDAYAFSSAQPTWPMPQLPDSSRLTVTAGLRWQPDTWPMEKADTMMLRAQGEVEAACSDDLASC